MLAVTSPLLTLLYYTILASRITLSYLTMVPRGSCGPETGDKHQSQILNISQTKVTIWSFSGIFRERSGVEWYVFLVPCSRELSITDQGMNVRHIPPGQHSSSHSNPWHQAQVGKLKDQVGKLQVARCKVKLPSSCKCLRSDCQQAAMQLTRSRCRAICRQVASSTGKLPAEKDKWRELRV